MLYAPPFFLLDEEALKANAPRDNAQMNPTLFVEDEEDEIFPRLVFNGVVAVFSSSNKERRSPLFVS